MLILEENMGEYSEKMAVIVGASHALKYKEKHPRAGDKEIIQYITENAEKIIQNIEDEED